MDINLLRNELSVRGKNGLPFLLSAAFVWVIFLIIFSLEVSIETKNLFSFFATGIMFPLAIVISTLVRADWKMNNHPLGLLGLYINLAQLMYFPILFWAFAKNPDEMIVFFAIITGAHLFPYGWYYNTKAFYVMAPVISVLVTVIGWGLTPNQLWYIPLTMIISLIILNIWLYMDYRMKASTEHSKSLTV